MSVHLHKGDLPADIEFSGSVAIDTETQGLSLVRDQLCLVQLSDGEGDAHIVQLDRKVYDCPNLKALLVDPNVEKIFHFARFDVAMIKKWLGVDTAPVYCTKIASALVRTYTDGHGLKALCKELLNVDLSKQQQSSDWGGDALSQSQLNYAASDVLYLHQLQRILTARLMREDRLALAQKCFEFLPARTELDLLGWNEIDIFSHSFR